MPQSTGKTTVGVTVTLDMKAKIKRVATLKHWSISQTLGLFLESHWDAWENSLGIEPEKSSTPKTSKKKSVS